jgi:hypothetical protein
MRLKFLYSTIASLQECKMVTKSSLGGGTLMEPDQLPFPIKVDTAARRKQAAT